MKRRNLAVSPVIGIIIMVAITVVLAAVIAWVIFSGAKGDYQTITVKDKCCSETGNFCYIYDTNGVKYMTDSDPGIYDRMQIGSTYRIRLMRYVIIDIMTMDEYNRTCEARGLC